MNELITEKIKVVHERGKKLEDTLKSLQNSIREVKDELIKLEGAMEVLVELKSSVVRVEPISVEPSIGEDDIKDLVDMLYIFRNFENMKNDGERKKQFMTEYGISDKNYDLILSIVPLFLGSEDCITRYEDISTSLFRHAREFVYNSEENIDGHDSSCK